MSKKVLVTGISGYLGQWVAAEALKQGFTVVGTVRSLRKVDVTKAAIAAVAPVDQLTFVEADLLTDGGWDAAMSGVDVVLHVASPFFIKEPKDESEMIGPAVGGTTRVLNAAKRAGVQRVVLTSSIVSMTSGKPSGTYDTTAWSDVTANIGTYAKSKTLAEKAAWDLVRDGSLELVVICPGFILGPSLGAPADGQSVSMMRDIVTGKMPAVPDVAMGMIDVRDVARLEVAAITADAAGQRFIAASAEPIPLAQLASVLRNAGYKKAPSLKAPNFAIKLMGMFDSEAKSLVPQLGVRIAYVNHTTFDVLGWQPTPLETTFVEMAATVAK